MHDLILTVVIALAQGTLFGFAFLAGAAPTATQSVFLRCLRSPAVFCAALALMLISGRWPWMAVPREMSPDESCFLAQAWRYSRDIVPWRATHSGTSGPLTPWLLAALWWCGAPLSYQTAHVTAAALQIAMLCLTYATIRPLAGELPARLATMPVAFLMARTGDLNFVHLSSENVPLVLLAGCACAAATAASRPRLSEGWLFVAGVFAGAVPFAKLQAVPTALVLTLIIAGGVWQRTVFARGRLQAGMALAAGGLFVPACLMGLVVAGGAWDEFWSLYIESNVAYGDKRTVNTPLFMRVASMIAKSPIFTILCLMTATLAGLAIARCISDRRTAQFVPALASTAAMVAIAVFSVAKPGFEFGHYLMLLTLPCMLLSGASLATILSPANREAASRSRLQPPAWAAFAVVAAVPVIVAFRCLTAGATFVEGAGVRRLRGVSIFVATER